METIAVLAFCTIFLNVSWCYGALWMVHQRHLLWRNRTTYQHAEVEYAEVVRPPETQDTADLRSQKQRYDLNSEDYMKLQRHMKLQAEMFESERIKPRSRWEYGPVTVADRGTLHQGDTYSSVDAVHTQVRLSDLIRRTRWNESASSAD